MGCLGLLFVEFGFRVRYRGQVRRFGKNRCTCLSYVYLFP